MCAAVVESLHITWDARPNAPHSPDARLLSWTTYSLESPASGKNKLALSTRSLANTTINFNALMYTANAALGNTTEATDNICIKSATNQVSKTETEITTETIFQCAPQDKFMQCYWFLEERSRQYDDLKKLNDSTLTVVRVLAAFTVVLLLIVVGMVVWTIIKRMKMARSHAAQQATPATTVDSEAAVSKE